MCCLKTTDNIDVVIAFLDNGNRNRNRHRNKYFFFFFVRKEIKSKMPQGKARS